jgi:hypothetical protein
MWAQGSNRVDIESRSLEYVMTDLNSQAKQMADEFMARNLDAQARAFLPAGNSAASSLPAAGRSHYSRYWMRHGRSCVTSMGKIRAKHRQPR